MTRLLSPAVLVGCLLSATVAGAQTRNLLNEMQGYTTALGVTCEFCHVAPARSDIPQPKKDIARQMIAMTRELNARVQLATGKTPFDATKVECATCHRGVTLPKPLGQIIVQTLKDKGPDEAEAQYRDLRARYYGRSSYDFGEDELLTAARSIAAIRPDDAITLLQLNVEFHPMSARSYALLGFAYTRKFDDELAIEHLEKAAELDPSNGEIQGQLLQLRSIRRRQ